MRHVTCPAVSVTAFSKVEGSGSLWSCEPCCTRDRQAASVTHVVMDIWMAHASCIMMHDGTRFASGLEQWSSHCSLFGMRTSMKGRSSASFRPLNRHGRNWVQCQWYAHIPRRKVNNGYEHRRREPARYISQSDSVPATMGNWDPWVSNGQMKLHTPYFHSILLILYLQNQPHSHRKKDRQTYLSDVYFLVFGQFQHFSVQHRF